MGALDKIKKIAALHSGNSQPQQAMNPIQIPQIANRQSTYLPPSQEENQALGEIGNIANAQPQQMAQNNLINSEVFQDQPVQGVDKPFESEESKFADKLEEEHNRNFGDDEKNAAEDKKYDDKQDKLLDRADDYFEGPSDEQIAQRAKTVAFYDAQIKDFDQNLMTNWQAEAKNIMEQKNEIMNKIATPVQRRNLVEADNFAGTVFKTAMFFINGPSTAGAAGAYGIPIGEFIQRDLDQNFNDRIQERSQLMENYSLMSQQLQDVNEAKEDYMANHLEILKSKMEYIKQNAESDLEKVNAGKSLIELSTSIQELQNKKAERASNSAKEVLNARKAATLANKYNEEQLLAKDVEERKKIEAKSAIQKRIDDTRNKDETLALNAKKHLTTSELNERKYKSDSKFKDEKLKDADKDRRFDYIKLATDQFNASKDRGIKKSRLAHDKKLDWSKYARETMNDLADQALDSKKFKSIDDKRNFDKQLKALRLQFDKGKHDDNMKHKLKALEAKIKGKGTDKLKQLKIKKLETEIESKSKRRDIVAGDGIKLRFNNDDAAKDKKLRGTIDGFQRNKKFFKTILDYSKETYGDLSRSFIPDVGNKIIDSKYYSLKSKYKAAVTQQKQDLRTKVNSGAVSDYEQKMMEQVLEVADGISGFSGSDIPKVTSNYANYLRSFKNSIISSTEDDGERSKILKNIDDQLKYITYIGKNYKQWAGDQKSQKSRRKSR